MIFSDFWRAVRQLPDPAFRRVLLLGLALTFGLLIVIFLLFLWAVQTWIPSELDLPWLGTVSGIDTLALVLSYLAMMTVFSVFLMVPVASVFTGFFLDDVADAVERKHYPWLPPAPGVGLYESLKDALNFFSILLVVNVIAFILSWFAGPLVPLIFWVVNGFLLGREYFTLAAMRRVGRQGAKRLRARHMGQIWFAGVLMAIPLSVPIVNLFIPLLGVATFTHMFHRLNRDGKTSGSDQSTSAANYNVG